MGRRAIRSRSGGTDLPRPGASRREVRRASQGDRPLKRGVVVQRKVRLSEAGPSRRSRGKRISAQWTIGSGLGSALSMAASCITTSAVYPTLCARCV
eukprot:scaffold9957_cov107-Isochrysis_galbana.AAC.5